METIGWITTVTLISVVLFKAFRVFFPKKYNERNCPEDHDTMERSGAYRCHKCNKDFYNLYDY